MKHQNITRREALGLIPAGMVAATAALTIAGCGATEEDAETEENTEPEESTVVEAPVISEATNTTRARDLCGTMSRDEKVMQLFVITPEALTGVDTATMAGEATQAALQTYPVGGLIYFAQNLENTEQTTEMLRNTQSFAKYGLFLCVDEEGGPLVARIGNNEGFSVEQFPSMLTIGESGDLDEAYRVGSVIGSYLSDLGFNVDFAPVADVLTNPDNQVIGSRSFGSDPQLDGEMVARVVEGLQEHRVLATLKHFPGHGNTEGDSHADTVWSNCTLEELQSTEFVPFEAGIEAGAACVMIGHINLPQATDDGLPATLSYEIVTGMLRDQLGFNGVVITDSMGMGAISSYYSSGEAAVMALQAGCDIILSPVDLLEARQGILDALNSGALTEERLDESVCRILTTKLDFGIITV